MRPTQPEYLQELIAREFGSASQALVDADGDDAPIDLAVLCAACQDLIGNAGVGQR